MCRLRSTCKLGAVQNKLVRFYSCAAAKYRAYVSLTFIAVGKHRDRAFSFPICKIKGWRPNEPVWGVGRP
jgi:hypothetical protein